MNVIRATLRFWVVIALIGWMVVVGIPITFRGGSVSNLGRCADDPTCGDLPWGAIWVVGTLIILAVAFLTRSRVRR